jgi:hypothetical protein
MSLTKINCHFIQINVWVIMLINNQVFYYHIYAFYNQTHSTTTIFLVVFKNVYAIF